MNSTAKQANQYDKILRENMDVALPGMIRNLLQIQMVTMKEIPSEIQHTKERKPDLLKEITDKHGKTYALHIEYQLRDDKDMVSRMAEYSIMLQRKYRIWVKQFVIFIGSGKPTMTQRITTEDHQYKYHLLSLSTIDYKLLLKSEKPEEKIFAVLGDFKSDPPLTAIKNILKDIQAADNEDLAEQRYFNQIRVLLQIRDLETQFDEVMESISTFFKEERDPFYKRGEKKGEHKKALQIARRLKRMGLPIHDIVKATSLSIDEIEKRQ